MADRNIRLRTLDRQIANKTQIALEAVNNWMAAQRPIAELYNPNRLFQLLENDQRKLVSYKHVLVNKRVSLQVYPYEREYYVFNMREYVFPMRIFIRNVKHSGFLYVGYDNDFPGPYDLTLATTCDYSCAITADILITLKNKKQKFIKSVYLAFVAEKDLLMLNFTIDFPEIASRRRSITEPDPQEIATMVTSQQTSQEKQTSRRLEVNQLPKVHSEAKEVSVRNSSVTLSAKETLQGPVSKHSRPITSTQNDEKLPVIQNYASGEKQNILNMNKRSLSQKTLTTKEVRQKRQVLDIYHEKDRMLREKAKQCAKLIENYQQIYDNEELRKRKINKCLLPLLFSVNFLVRSHSLIKAHANEIDFAKKIDFLCKKFATKLKRKMKSRLKEIPFSGDRRLIDCICTTRLLGRSVVRYASSQGTEMISHALKGIALRLTMNSYLDLASEYRKKVRKIQRQWKSKYHNRKLMLIEATRLHVGRMVKEHPHLARFADEFVTTTVCSDIVRDYIADEGRKYQQLYLAYLKTMSQIDDMVRANHTLIVANSKLIRKKPLLSIPVRPLRPHHRFFRDVDILKTTVRTWFELKHKVWFKKNSQKKE